MLFRFPAIILSLHLLLNIQLWAMVELESEYSQRLTKFTANRANHDVYTHTTHIYQILSDETKVSNTKATTDEQRKRILLPIVASGMIHEQIENNDVRRSDAGQKRIIPFTYNQKSTKAGHFRVIQIADELSRKLAINYKIYGYRDLLKDTKEKFDDLERYSSVTAKLFMDCFYEAFEQHYDEFSYFDKQDTGAPTSSIAKINRIWFADVQQCYQRRSYKIHKHKTDERETEYLFIQHAPDAIPFAIYKPTKPTVPGGTTRAIMSECLSSLFAKSAKLDDVVNRVIPVSAHGDTLVFDPVTPTGTVERFLGFSENQITGDSPFSRLLRNVCAYNNKKRPSTVGDLHAKSHQLNQKVISRMFVAHYRVGDIRTFSDPHTINIEYLYKIMFFWYLSDYIDMHTGNIIFMPDFARQQLVPIIIDTEMTWGQRSMVRNIPILYQLNQARTALPSSQMGAILGAFDLNKLTRLIKVFPPIKREFRTNNTLTKATDNLLLEGHFNAHFSTLMGLREQSITIGQLLRNCLQEPKENLYTIPYYVKEQRFMTGLPWIYSVFNKDEFNESYTLSEQDDSLGSSVTKEKKEWYKLLPTKELI